MSNAGRYFGRLWSRGYESLLVKDRSVICIQGKGSGKYLQGLTTNDVLLQSGCKVEQLPRSEIPLPSGVDDDDDEEEQHHHNQEQQQPIPTFNPRLQPTCFLDERGRILTDGMLWKPHSSDKNEAYRLEVPTSSKDLILDHLQRYKVGRNTKKVSIEEVTESSNSVHAIYGTLSSSGNDDVNPNPPLQMGLDPRHPSLGLRLLSNYENTTPEDRHDKLSHMLDANMFPDSPGTYDLLRHLNGIAEGHAELNKKTPLECNMDWLGDTISFHKGCYLGQELTARSFYKGVVRKRVIPLFFVDTHTELPVPWKYSYKHYRDIHFADDDENVKSSSDVVHVVEDEDELPKLDSIAAGVDFLPLPRLGVYDAAAVMSLLHGIHPTGDNPIQNMASALSASGGGGVDMDNTTDASAEEQASLSEKSKQQQLHLLDELRQHCQRGSKITNHYNGQTVGEIISMGAFGDSSLVLAQVRLEYVHLLQSSSSSAAAANTLETGEKNQGGADAGIANAVEPEDHSQWKPTNKVKVGDSKMEMRMLPYIPLWWPKVNPVSGKAAAPDE
jgi:folate-binding protein YgfZ